MRTLANGYRALDTRTALPALKQADPELLTAEHQAWRKAVLKRAGYRCEAVERGARCPRRYPEHRIYADHIVERKDGGALYDPLNGKALCASHHVLKTNAERARRMGVRGV